MGELIQFPVRKPEPLEPVSEFIAVKPDLWERLIGGLALGETVGSWYEDDGETIVRGDA